MQTNTKFAILVFSLRTILRASACIICFAAAAVLSNTLFWISPEKGDTVWSTGANWSGGRSPANGDTVIFGKKGEKLAQCALDEDASVAAIVFRKEYASPFDFNGHKLAITGLTADFRSGGTIASGNGKGGIVFEGTGRQNFYANGSRAFFPAVTLRCGPKGGVFCLDKGIKTDTLIITSGTLHCGPGLTHQIGNVQTAGGSLAMDSSSLVLSGTSADLSLASPFLCEKGTLVLVGDQPQHVIFPLDTQTIHRLVQAGKGGAALSKTSSRGIFVDSLEIKAGTLCMKDSAGITANVFLSSHGGLIVPHSHHITIRTFADFGALDTLQLQGSLICAARKSSVSIIPKSNASLASVVVARGKMQAAVFGLVADTLIVFPACTLSLGKGLIHSVNVLRVGNDAVINFESSALRYAGDTLDFSSAGALIPGTGSLEFAGISPQTFIPKSGQVHPSIIQNGTGGTTLSSRNLAAGNLFIYAGKFNLNGFFASVDSVKGASLRENDTLEFGTSSLSLLRARGGVYFDNLTVHGGIRLEMAGSGQELRLDGNSRIVKLVIMGALSTSIIAATDAQVLVDTLAIRSGILDLGKNPAAPFTTATGSLFASGGGINFGGSILVFTGDTADLSRLSMPSPRQEDGGIEFGGKVPQVFVPKTDALYPSIIQSGAAGTSVITNGFSCSRLVVKTGTLRLGTALSHTVVSRLRIAGGGLDFGTSTLSIQADSVNLSGCDTLIPGNGTLSFTGASGPQFFIPKENTLHPNLIKAGNGNVVLSGLCKAKKLWISGGTFDCGGSKCMLSGFSAIGGTLTVGKDSLIITGNALFTGLNGLVTATGPVVVRAGAGCPVSIFSCTKQTISRLVLSALPSGGNARIIAGAGTHRVRYCTFEWNKSGDSAIFDFRQNSAALAVLDSADAAPLGTGPDRGSLYMGNGTWTFQGNFALANYARDGSKIVFSRDSGTQTVRAPLPLADVVHSGRGSLFLLSAVKCRNFTHSAGILDFRGNAVSPENDFLLVNGSDSSIAASGPGWRIEAGKNVSLNGSLRSYCTISNAPACTVNAAGALTARYAIIKNCRADRQKGIASNSLDSLGNTNWSFTNKPPPLSGLVAKRGNGSVSLLWNRSPESDVMRYLIYSGSDAGALSKLDSTRSAFDTAAGIDNLTNGKTYRFCVTVLDSAGYESDCSNQVLAVPDSGLLDISAIRLSFGKVGLGASRDSAITLYNGCSDTVIVTSVKISSPAFTRGSASIRIPPRRSVQDTLRFAPEAGGPDSAFVIYTSNAASSPDTIRVSGEGLSPCLTIGRDTIVFELTQADKSVSRTVVLKNMGNDTLRVSQVSRLGTGDFISDSMFTMSTISDLAPGDSCLDTIRFFPRKAGIYSAFFLIKSNCSTPLDTIAVLGKTGIPPATQAAAPAIPKEFSLGEAVVVGRTVIFKYALPSASRVTLDIYNAIGRFIERPLEMTQAAREYQFTWDGSHLSRGIYFCRFKASDSEAAEPKFVKTIRLVFSK
jgi:hypothetical protein